jgi:hypothetical protein
MNILRLALYMLATCTHMLSHAETSPPAASDMSDERVQIAEQRKAAEVIFLHKQQSCYARFAVSDCLSQIRRERRATLDPLRTREVQLNELDRKARSLEVTQRLQRNVSAERQQELELQRQQALSETSERQLRSDEKRVMAAKPEIPALSAPGLPASAAKSQAALSEQQRYTEKRQQAQQRKADKANSLSQKGKGTAKSLPIPAGQ